MEKSFVFGTATAAYQVEGAAHEGGRTPCIWDTFAKQPGAVKDGEDGAVACDHYHRYKEDIALMKELGTDSYRFSIAWPRIFPAKDHYNPEGMRFYKNVLAELKKQGIKAAVTLYHWDLPQWAEELGGWQNRACADWFVTFAAKCFEELDADVDMWITHNEPWCASFLSYFIGEHAPGHRNLAEALVAAHHILLSHGMAVRVYRAMHGAHPIGITDNLSPVYAKTVGIADSLARVMQDGYQNRWFLDPVFKKRYPADMLTLFAARTATDYAFVHEGDLEIIGEPIDFLGINFYSRNYVRYDPAALLLTGAAPSDKKQTDMGWDVCPETLADLLRQVRGYTALPVYITENGSAWKDTLEDGAVHDVERVDYLLRHLRAVEQCNAEGLDIAGYYCWSFMDNFEWAHGYSKRFGIVYLDYATQARIPKDSFYAYRDYIRAYKAAHAGR
ncbi:GH1 family beta-glucosidase [Ethanoligenens harbinense]|uniref:Beta-glucosidase n=1 Tax=Ethanoligenens harbinense (strain DSM 18485 / JCM 12961 / CGMCC 1.5033 / YUAN-3) TaxID=663278 RepID=E6U3G5_ETHHY|nr:GH1 family beta-glucosidase [Ethanoligenens harbinense]ADU26457.1 beta-galactosidase [Ethanoligenens harbinense YUAN-3]AVQ95586.1 beta-glucosidase [Ethanoligenens harbinense YUAN-3]AYF38250.1 beta-glucosidase [Ethanoligenens harbinense]AYF40996.1 beta-glucosidase [Ethanoligenens harbinense]QCN91826.1 beta-glucosidase [Ethanoligenens harbinense]